MIIEALAQRFTQRLAGMNALITTGLGSLRVAQTEGEGDEMTRAGLRIHMSATGATGVAPVQAIPSTAAQWLIYNPQGNTTTAFLDVLGMVDLPLPGGMDMAGRTTDEDTKISMRFLRGFDITENQFISRLDCLYVVAAPRPQFAVRVVG